MHRYKDFEFWKQSRILNKEIYLVTAKFPDEEKFGLISQIRRASVSISFNIAEGCSRRSNKDLYRFLEISLGSAYEVDTGLVLAYDLNFISEEELNNLSFKLDSIIRMMSKFMSTVR